MLEPLTVLDLSHIIIDDKIKCQMLKKKPFIKLTRLRTNATLEKRVANCATGESFKINFNKEKFLAAFKKIKKSGGSNILTEHRRATKNTTGEHTENAQSRLSNTTSTPHPGPALYELIPADIPAPLAFDIENAREEVEKRSFMHEANLCELSDKPNTSGNHLSNSEDEPILKRRRPDKSSSNGLEHFEAEDAERRQHSPDFSTYVGPLMSNEILVDTSNLTENVPFHAVSDQRANASCPTAEKACIPDIQKASYERGTDVNGASSCREEIMQPKPQKKRKRKGLHHSQDEKLVSFMQDCAVLPLTTDKIEDLSPNNLLVIDKENHGEVALNSMLCDSSKNILSAPASKMPLSSPSELLSGSHEDGNCTVINDISPANEESEITASKGCGKDSASTNAAPVVDVIVNRIMEETLEMSGTGEASCEMTDDNYQIQFSPFSCDPEPLPPVEIVGPITEPLVSNYCNPGQSGDDSSCDKTITARAMLDTPIEPISQEILVSEGNHLLNDDYIIPESPMPVRIADVRTVFDEQGEEEEPDVGDPNFSPSKICKRCGLYQFYNGAKIACVYRADGLYCVVHEIVIKLKLKIDSSLIEKPTAAEILMIRSVRIHLKNNFDIKLVSLDAVKKLLPAPPEDKSITVTLYKVPLVPRPSIQSSKRSLLTLGGPVKTTEIVQAIQQTTSKGESTNSSLIVPVSEEVLAKQVPESAGLITDPACHQCTELKDSVEQHDHLLPVQSVHSNTDKESGDSVNTILSPEKDLIATECTQKETTDKHSELDSTGEKANSLQHSLSSILGIEIVPNKIQDVPPTAQPEQSIPASTNPKIAHQQEVGSPSDALPDLVAQPHPSSSREVVTTVEVPTESPRDKVDSPLTESASEDSCSSVPEIIHEVSAPPRVIDLYSHLVKDFVIHKELPRNHAVRVLHQKNGLNKTYKGLLYLRDHPKTPFMIKCMEGCNQLFGAVDFMSHVECIYPFSTRRLWTESIRYDTRDDSLVSRAIWNAFCDFFTRISPYIRHQASVEVGDSRVVPSRSSSSPDDVSIAVAKESTSIRHSRTAASNLSKYSSGGSTLQPRSSLPTYASECTTLNRERHQSSIGSSNQSSDKKGRMMRNAFPKSIPASNAPHAPVQASTSQSAVTRAANTGLAGNAPVSHNTKLSPATNANITSHSNAHQWKIYNPGYGNHQIVTQDTTHSTPLASMQTEGVSTTLITGQNTNHAGPSVSYNSVMDTNQLLGYSSPDGASTSNAAAEGERSVHSQFFAMVMEKQRQNLVLMETAFNKLEEEKASLNTQLMRERKVNQEFAVKLQTLLTEKQAMEMEVSMLRSRLYSHGVFTPVTSAPPPSQQMTNGQFGRLTWRQSK